jgi:hypothetical protein
MLHSYCQPVEPAQTNQGAGGKDLGHPMDASPTGEAAPILALRSGIVYWEVWVLLQAAKDPGRPSRPLLVLKARACLGSTAARCN